MYPTIQGGDLIVINKDEATNVKRDDVISFFDPTVSNNTVVTHRVTEVTKNNGMLGFYTKGDANTNKDKAFVPYTKFIGKYSGTRYPGLGNFCMWLKSVPGIIVCVGIPLLLFVGYDILRSRRYAKKQESQAKA